MEFKFRDIDDLEFIIPPDKQKSGNDYKALVDTFFPDKRDLIISLIELVSLSDIEAVGERYLFSEHIGEDGKEILGTYEAIINYVQREKKINIAYYLDWYNRQSYILKQSQPYRRFSFPKTRIDWEQAPSTMRDVKKRNETKFANLKTDELSEDIIEDYLSYYNHLLHNELEFKQYPNYCVIVRPIAVSEGKKTVPLGNIFLHFATMTEKTDEFYLRLINDFLLVWFKENGVKMIGEIQHKAIQQDKESKTTKIYLPNFSHLSETAHDRLSRTMNERDNYSLQTYFDDTFSSPEKIEEFKKKCLEMAKIAIDKFIILEKYCRDENTDISNLKLEEITDCIRCDRKFWNKEGHDKLKERYDPKFFETLLLKRELFKIGFLYFEISKSLLVNFIANGEVNKSLTSPGSDYSAIWSQMFIPWRRKEIRYSEVEEFRERIKNSFSTLEKELSDEYKELKKSSS